MGVDHGGFYVFVAEEFLDGADIVARFQKVLTQNNYAYAYAVNYDGRPESFAGVDQTLYAAAYALRRRRTCGPCAPSGPYERACSDSFRRGRACALRSRR